jgi:hypothetical protein
LTARREGSIINVGFPIDPHKEEKKMNTAIREYDAKVDSKKRLTLRESPYEYYHVEHYADGRIMLQPRELVEPFRVSENTLSMMDKSMENMNEGKAGKAIDLSKFEE